MVGFFVTVLVEGISFPTTVTSHSWNGVKLRKCTIIAMRRRREDVKCNEMKVEENQTLYITTTQS